MLKKEEMLEILRTLEFDSEAMGKLLEIIDSVEGDILDQETLHQIKLILLEEEEKALDAAAADVGVDVASDPSLIEVENIYKKEIEDIKSEFESDMRSLDDDMDSLDHADTELTRVSETIEITRITQSIQAS